MDHPTLKCITLFFPSTLPCPPFHIPCSAFPPAPSPLWQWFFLSLCSWESTVIVSNLEALWVAAEPQQPSAAQRPVTWDLWLMLSVNNMDLLKESVGMPSEIRERAACLALRAFFMASSGIQPPGTGIWKSCESLLSTSDVSAFPLAFKWWIVGRARGCRPALLPR